MNNLETIQRFRVSCMDTSNEHHPSTIYQHIEVEAESAAEARRLADERHGIELLRHAPKRTYYIEPVEG